MTPAPKPEPRAKKPRKPLTSKGGPERDTARMVYVGTLPCVACESVGLIQRSRSQADHIRSRGAGGKEVGNLWPLCAKHHDERHIKGLRRFAYEYDVIPQAEGAFVEAAYLEFTGGV